MDSTERDAKSFWREYYALRNRARLSVLAAVFVLALVTGPLTIALIDRVNLPQWGSIALLFGVNGAAIVLFSLPMIKWSNWRCPRCGKAFAQPTAYRGNVLAILVRFLSPSCCANCGLLCSADPQQH